jgi:glyoxylase I family protein
MEGFAHTGLATHNMAATITFYENVLGFSRVADIYNNVESGGAVRMVYFRCGKEQFLVFMECKGVHTIPENFDTGINRGLGVPTGLYHIAFKIRSTEALEEKRIALKALGVEVSNVVDHGYARSIFIRDPNDLQLEFTCMTRAFRADDLDKTLDVIVAHD